jgi:hypothetical protein
MASDVETEREVTVSEKSEVPHKGFFPLGRTNKYIAGVTLAATILIHAPLFYDPNLKIWGMAWLYVAYILGVFLVSILVLLMVYQR